MLRAGPPMEPYDTQFREKTEAFGWEHAFRPAYGEGGALQSGSFEEGASYKRDESQEDFPVLRAIGRCRVAFASIVPEPEVKNGYLVMLYRQPAGRRFPIYWLPYDARGGLSSMIKLKPSKKLDVEAPGYDSSLFVTDALNGCTITISGTAEEPIIYHSPQVDSNIRARVNAFHRSYEQRKERPERSVGHWGNDEYGAFFPHLDYEGRSGSDLLGREEGRLTRETGARKNTLRITEGATVFGRRDGGTWQLYCQEWIHYGYDEGIFFVTSHQEKCVRRCYPIWPPAEHAPPTATVFVGSTLGSRGLL